MNYGLLFDPAVESNQSGSQAVQAEASGTCCLQYLRSMAGCFGQTGRGNRIEVIGAFI